MASRTTSIITHILVYLGGIITVGFIHPFAIDVYKSTVGRWFTPDSRIELSSVSNSTLEPLKNYSDEGYYEITTFIIENSGRKATNKDDQIKIQARGNIIGITPKELGQRLKIDDKDKSIAYLNIGRLDPGGEIRGEIHSLSNVFIDRNEAQIGFDKIGGFKFIGPNPL